jgi:hypothetical protein
LPSHFLRASRRSPPRQEEARGSGATKSESAPGESARPGGSRSSAWQRLSERWAAQWKVIAKSGRAAGSRVGRGRHPRGPDIMVVSTLWPPLASTAARKRRRGSAGGTERPLVGPEPCLASAAGGEEFRAIVGRPAGLPRAAEIDRDRSNPRGTAREHAELPGLALIGRERPAVGLRGCADGEKRARLRAAGCDSRQASYWSEEVARYSGQFCLARRRRRRAEARALATWRTEAQLPVQVRSC